MNFIYIFLSYFAGVFSMLAIIYIYKKSEIPKSPPKEEEYNQAVQFIEPEPLKDKLKDGTNLNEIIQ